MIIPGGFSGANVMSDSRVQVQPISLGFRCFVFFDDINVVSLE